MLVENGIKTSFTITFWKSFFDILSRLSLHKKVKVSSCIVQVRYYDKKFEEEDEMFDDEMDLDGCEMDEVELRS